MKRISLHKVMAKLAEEKTEGEKLLLAQQDTLREAEATYRKAFNDISGKLMGAAMDVDKYAKDIYINSQELERMTAQIKKMESEFGFSTDMIPKLENELKEVERYFRQLNDWQDAIKKVQKGVR